ncbi:MAG: prepilin-type N-terminal cleavage/methylation domain-containing protein [Chthoniobacter sp.]
MIQPLTNLARGRRRGFTLLEVMIAVLILTLTSFAIYRFVRGTLKALSVSVSDTEDQLALERLVALVQEGLYGIPPPRHPDPARRQPESE